MMRAAVLAACLLALAAGAHAAAAARTFDVTTCTEGHLKLEYVAPRGNDDPIAKCLTSVRLDISSTCQVSLTPLQSSGSHVPGLWAADPDLIGLGPIQNTKWIECPSEARPAIQATTNFASITNPGQKLEAVRRAIIKAFAGHVYGLDEWGNYVHKLEVNDLDFFKGVLMVKRSGDPTYGDYNLMYAVTENTVNLDDVKQDNDVSALSVIEACIDLRQPLNPYDEAEALCLANDVADGPCPANSYPVMMVPDLNEDDEKDTAFKVCGLCPAGTAGDGFGCTSCQAGEYSTIGNDCAKCPIGTYSNAGSSVCIPCPTGTYADTEGTQECLQCPEDSYSWIPGAAACLRCIRGVPEACRGGVCPSGTPEEFKAKSTPATSIVSVSKMGALGSNDVCDLAGEFEIPALTKCTSWKEDSPSLQLAFRVAGDCSIQISPITDPSCADPTDPRTSDVEGNDAYNADVHPYGKTEMRGYYTWDADTDVFSIRSLFGVQIDDHTPKDAAIMLAVEKLAGDELSLKIFGATTNAAKATLFPVVDALPIQPEICTSTLRVLGGDILGATPAPVDACPPGSYYDTEEMCPTCPVGFSCPGNEDPELAKIVPCSPNTYNPFLGFSGDCQECTGLGLDTYTSYAAAQQCDVDRVDLACDSDDYKNEGSFAYEQASQLCQKCAAGTWRNYEASTECEPCPEGTYSAEGDATCKACPPGEYNPLQGLADQFEITGYNCVVCAEGSVALNFATFADATATLGALGDNPLVPGATVCDACPAGTFLPDYKMGCVQCIDDTYRAGDATPENNVCKPIPAGYRLLNAGDKTAIDLCPKGQVSFYTSANQDNGDRVPAGKPEACIACAALADELLTNEWAHTFAPRKGMTQCIPCPGGTIPSNTGSGATYATFSCKACGNGLFRDAYTKSASCAPCGPGKEVGPSSKMACSMCRAGTYMNATRAGKTTTEANTCDLCPIHTYRPAMGALSCLPCPRGTQTSNTGNVECTACPIGYHNNQAGTACEAADKGTFVNTTGAYVSTPCPKGTWNNEQAQDNCNPCAPGKYSNTFGSTECKTCAAGTYSAGQATACKDCRPGYFAPAGAAACSPCKPGTYAPVGTSATCKLCPKGYQCPTNAMKAVGSCPKGTFSNKEGNKQCTPCPTNTYSNGGGAAPTAVMACIKCAPGTNTRGLVGQSKCQVIRPQVKRLF
ncbi:serine threonine [Micractinium conductrix]|uniref:Serine threonine n=1 Tax=Micractinium conductrix TaxID=554055 RepID=A0A2P6VM93_9CHLO|nr:serine threonine [Micractinium conductrix]|eukprot:PSC75222.1 serine threonine [Micractinium conductrix]